MTVFAQALLTLVRSHLMSFAFFSAWHVINSLDIGSLFFLANLIFYLGNEGFCRLK
jgi:hypothetical protein